MQALGPDDEPLLGAFGVDGRGQVAAVMAPDAGGGHIGRPAVWRDGRVVRRAAEGVVARPVDISERGRSYAYDINDRGQIAGMTLGTDTRAVPPHRRAPAPAPPAA